jgi:hypothetical protein
MRKLTEKMERFAEEYVRQSYNGSLAYQIAYQNENKEVCNAEAYHLLHDPRIIERIAVAEGDYKIVGHAMGVDKKFIMARVKDMLMATKKIVSAGQVVSEEPDYIAINNGIDKWAKLTGDFSPEKKAILVEESSPLGDVNPEKLTVEEKENLRREILKDMA